MANNPYTFRFGKNKDGQAVRSRNAGPWHIIEGVTIKQVKDALETAWPYNDAMKGLTLKDICAKDAEWLDMNIELLHAHLPHVKAATMLIRNKK